MAKETPVKASGTAPEVVTLKTKNADKPRKKSFPLEQANKLIKLKNSQWELDDKGYKFNGTELAKA